MMGKNLLTTYLLWLFGGFFGLHHFYLERDYHALVWWMTAGGYFGLGLIRDLWRIPYYVQDANDDPSIVQSIAEKISAKETPPFKTVQYFGQITLGDLFGYLMTGAIPYELIPETYHSLVSSFLVPFAVASGIYLVGSIGRNEGSYVHALIGAFGSLPFYYVMDQPIGLTSFISCYYFNRKKKYCQRRQRHLTQRFALLGLWGVIYLSLWASFLYFNCTIVTEDNEKIICRDAVKNFFRSPIWKEFVKVMKEMWRVMSEHGLLAVWKQLKEAFDFTGEIHALRVLGLEYPSTQHDITIHYRKLSREWHPDKHKDIDQKNLAQERFIEIQQAYETLSQIKSRRLVRNNKDQDEGDAVKIHEEL